MAVSEAHILFGEARWLYREARLLEPSPAQAAACQELRARAQQLHGQACALLNGH
jgi:hypothetical protein